MFINFGEYGVHSFEVWIQCLGVGFGAEGVELIADGLGLRVGGLMLRM